ncbi:MAG TPA: amidohydrolase family protein [Pirellulales bacterium]|nr:amidohydrolase family protein [Pirellulales bacterium]
MPTSLIAQVEGRHYRTRRPVRVEIVDGQIAAVHELDSPPAESGKLPWLAPAFIDVQTNGYGGQEFSSAELTPQGVLDIARHYPRFGVARFCPTVTTASSETIVHAMRTIVEACRRDPALDYAVAGIHLEGPYISPHDGPRGAHPVEHCRAPNWDEFVRFQEAADGRIRLITLSPEYPEAIAFIERAVASGVVVALGHANIDSAQIRAAVNAGASLSTHLGNGAHRLLRRHPNYLWDQLAEDRLMASLIVDGHHLPEEVVRTFVRAKTPQRCLLISDLSGMAGLPPGRYETGLCDLEILDDGRLVIAGQDQLLAGASRGIHVGVANVMHFAGLDLAAAIDMASQQPAQLLGLPPAGLQSGDSADFVLFHLDERTHGPATLDVIATISRGQSLYQAS